MNLIKKICNKVKVLYYVKKGFSPYVASFHIAEFKEEHKKSDFPKSVKKWTYKRGFYPWRIAHYGLTEENYKNVISDMDYYYLYPLNNRYSVWIDDKLTMKYVLAPFDKFMPRYYYHLMKNRAVMRLMDCEEGYGSTIEDVIRFIEAKGQVAAKMSAGTYGIGFYKLAFKNGIYFVSDEEKNYDEFKEFLLSLDDYIITEFVEQHPDIKKLNPYSVNTVRVVVINENGDKPIIPFAFMRVGTQKSGFVDNVAQGGMVVKIDVDTGRFHSAETLINHVYYAKERHPDTNEKMEGFIPNWDIVLKGIEDICNYCPQLKWLGFDIAVTQDGFSIIEINSHAGLHKAHEYPEEVNNFLHKELKLKKAKFGIK